MIGDAEEGTQAKEKTLSRLWKTVCLSKIAKGKSCLSAVVSVAVAVSVAITKFLRSEQSEGFNYYYR